MPNWGISPVGLADRRHPCDEVESPAERHQMTPHKSFKVASISTKPNSFGLHGYIMVAEDGEAWTVGRTRSGSYPTLWEQGQVVEVPLTDDPVRHITGPAWGEVQCETPQRLADAPPVVVAELWGKPVEPAAEPVPPREVKPSIVFTPAQFTPTQFHSAQEKADFANLFVRFVENGFQHAHFSEAFYRRLCQTFGHVAHFNRDTFYRTFFSTSADKLRFLRQTVDHEPVGEAGYTFSDAETLLRAWVVGSGVIDRVAKTAAHAQSRAEREELKKLLDKHGTAEG